jgi:hypothetical protein
MTPLMDTWVRDSHFGSKAVLTTVNQDFRDAPESGHFKCSVALPGHGQLGGKLRLLAHL